MADATVFDRADSVKEEWRPVVGYEGMYEVSTLGNVRRIARNKGARVGRILKKSGPRHQTVCLYRDNVRCRFYVHRLVATSFLGHPPAGKPHVLHGDGNPQNNRVENLRWGSHADNMGDAVVHGTNARGERHGNHKLTVEGVRFIRKMKAEGWGTTRLARHLGVAVPTVNGVTSGNKWGWVE